MLDLIVVLAILTLLGKSVGMYAFNKYTYNRNKHHNDDTTPPPSFSKGDWTLVVFAILLSFINTLWFNAELGKYYVTQDVTGVQTGVTEAGPTVCIGCGLIALRDYDRLSTLVLSGRNMGEQDTSGDTELETEQEGKTSTIIWEVPTGAFPPAECRFADNVVAYVSGTFNFPMPSSSKDLVSLGNQFTSKDAFIKGVALPAVQNIIRVACRMTTAQDFYAGNGGILETAIQEMLSKGGKYEVTVKKETIAEVQTDANKADGLNPQISRPDAVVYKSELIKDANGLPVITPLKLQEFNINPTSSITDVTPEPGFSRRLAKARDVAAKQNLAVRNTQLAADNELQYEAEGRANLAKENARLKLEQAKKVIAAETEAKKAIEKKARMETEAAQRLSVAETDKETAQILLDKANLDAQAITAIGKAKAKVKELNFKADGALKLRLEMQKETAIGVAEKLANGNNALVPNNFFGGSNGQEGGEPASAMDTMTKIMAVRLANQLPKAEGKQKNDATK